MADENAENTSSSNTKSLDTGAEIANGTLAPGGNPSPLHVHDLDHKTDPEGSVEVGENHDTVPKSKPSGDDTDNTTPKVDSVIESLVNLDALGPVTIGKEDLNHGDHPERTANDTVDKPDEDPTNLTH